MRVLVVNKMSNNHGKIGVADEAAWDRNDFWIPVSFDGSQNLVAKRDLQEV